jgi:hypothetical protein
VTQRAAKLTIKERKRLERAYADLLALSMDCDVPSVQAAARAALAQIHAALNGQGLHYALYSKDFKV